MSTNMPGPDDDTEGHRPRSRSAEDEAEDQSRLEGDDVEGHRRVGRSEGDDTDGDDVEGHRYHH
jgi:hypothetical protein